MSTETKAAFGVGVPLTLKSMGPVEVKELTLESFVRISSDIAAILKFLTTETSGDSDPISWLSVIIADPRTLQALKALASACVGRPVSDFDHLGLSDWVKLGGAIRSSTDWGEVATLFQQLLPKLFRKD
jgi:hypothetical protein